MASEKHRFVCECCKSRQNFHRRKPNHPLHIALVVATGGLWSISYIAIMIGNPFRPWTCAMCDRIQKAPPGKNTNKGDWKENCRRMYRRLPPMPGEGNGISYP